MAQMLPASIPDKASRGEKLLFKALKQLPDDYIVWYEPTIERQLPDFVILGPTFGLLIIEVKGWYAGSIEVARHDTFQIRYKRHGKTKIEGHTNPLKQGHSYFAAISDKMSSFPLLCRSDGGYQGKLSFPIGAGAVMSNITEAQSRSHALYTVLEQPAVAYKDELQQWADLSSRELIGRLKGMFKTDFAFPPLTDDQISTIKGILHPTTIVKEVPAVESSLPDEVDEPLPLSATRLLSLDLEQERLARTMSSGHRLISGVAGSGKTLILLARAKTLANGLLPQRVLILCFNITLAAHLRSLIHSDSRNPQYKERIEVLHFHSWAKKLLGRLPKLNEENRATYDTLLGKNVLAAVQTLPEAQRWDAILVDEAHAFDRSWFPCCVAALKNPDAGDLLIVSDRNQGLYKRTDFSWKSVGINAVGRSRKLAQNYRNTQEILSAAWDVLKPTAANADSAFEAVEPSDAIRQGRVPTLRISDAQQVIIKQVCDQVKTLASSGYSLADIAIIYKQRNHAEFKAVLSSIREEGMLYYWISADKNTKQRYDSQRPGIRVVTALSSLGLEFKAILLLWPEHFWRCCSKDIEEAERERRQLYVAMTRAQDELHIFSNSKAQIVDELKQSGNFLIL